MTEGATPAQQKEESSQGQRQALVLVIALPLKAQPGILGRGVFLLRHLDATAMLLMIMMS
jgi:hypothetical protein